MCMLSAPQRGRCCDTDFHGIWSSLCPVESLRGTVLLCRRICRSGPLCTCRGPTLQLCARKAIRPAEGDEVAGELSCIGPRSANRPDEAEEAVGELQSALVMEGRPNATALFKLRLRM